MTDFPEIERVLERHPEILAAYVFGSVARGDAGRESDLDMAVQTARPLDVDGRLALIEELADVTGRPADLIDLSTVGEPLLGEIHRGVRLRGDDARHAALMSRHVMASQDFLPYVRRMLAERRQTWTR